METKSIVCFTESMAGGGAEHQMSFLANFLVEKGYNVSLVTYTDIPDHYPTNDAINRVVIGKGKGKIRKAFDIFKFFIRVKTNCVITFRQRCNARALLPLLFRPNIKVIAGERNTTKGSPDFYERLLFGFLYGRADWIVANSITQRDYLYKSKPKWQDKTLTIHNYTDLSIFTPEDSVFDNISLIRIGVFSRFSKQKNFDGFARMLALLKNKTTIKFKVTWYGQTKGPLDGFNADYLRCRELITTLSLEDVIELRQAVHNVADYINKYHAICLPSLYEGFSNSVAEGICSGRPMLVSNVSDNKYMVIDGRNGFLFDPENIQCMCNAFLEFFQLDSVNMKKYGKESRSIAEKLFSKELFVRDYVRLIES